jgi:NADH:ubiquinone oxidoreductase subunit 3 (subunit A)
MALFEIMLIIFFIVSLLYIASFIISITSKDYEKYSAYECGFEPIHTNARLKFEIIYWVIGILYLIFDLELIFIFPLATILYSMNSLLGIIIYLIFIIILTIGFIYEWQQGALKFN